MKKVKIIERGWAGHFCAASQCSFRRNTLIEYENKKFVVSTVGAYKYGNDFTIIGADRYYETMAFEAQYEEPYWEANVSREIDFNSDWTISTCDLYSDGLANNMHEKIVDELSKKIKL